MFSLCKKLKVSLVSSSTFETMSAMHCIVLVVPVYFHMQNEIDTNLQEPPTLITSHSNIDCKMQNDPLLIYVDDYYMILIHTDITGD